MSHKSDTDIASATARFLGEVVNAVEGETFVPSSPPPSHPSGDFMGAAPEAPPMNMNEIRTSQAVIYTKIQKADASALSQIASLAKLFGSLIGSILK